MGYFYNQLLLFVFCDEIYTTIKHDGKGTLLGFAKISSIFGVCSKYPRFFGGSLSDQKFLGVQGKCWDRAYVAVKSQSRVMHITSTATW